MRKKLLSAISLFIGCALTGCTYGDKGGVAVAELFTSQSCSSCPPADEVLADLAEEKNVIALGCHVTYWDHPGWKDTLSQSFCTDRQAAYQKLLGNHSSYTPQMVIDGRAEMVGSRGTFVTLTAKIAARNGEVLPLALKLKKGMIKTALPDIDPNGGTIALTLFAFDDRDTQKIQGGENNGRTVSYVHAVRAMTELGFWDGHRRELAVKIPDANVTGGYALLVQDTSTGAIRAAGQISLETSFFSNR